MRGVLYGVAINDSKTPVRETVQVNGKTVEVWGCPFYKVWVQMLVRCYSQSYKKKYKYDYSPTVCSEWLNFSVFREWMQLQDWSGKQLDKDILIPGNKHYSPETCVFVPQELNKFFNLHRNRKSATLTGVTKNCRGSRYTACITRDGKTNSLGGFATELEAHHAWIREKILDLGKFICNYGSRLDERLIEIRKNLRLHIENKTVFEKF